VTTINFKKIFFFLLLIIMLGGAVAALPPSIISLSPTSEPQGWTGHLTITGSNFASGATVTDGAGLTDAATGLHIIQTTFISSTTLDAYVRVAAGAATGLAARKVISFAGSHLLTVTNPDGATGTIDAFTVTAGRTDPAFDSIFIDGAPYTAGMSISRQPRISGNITAAQGLTQAGSGTDFKILVDNVVKYDNLTGNVSLDAADPAKAAFRYTLLPYAAFGGALDIHLNIKDKNGNTGEFICSVNVQVPVQSSEVTIVSPPTPDPASSKNHQPTPANPISMQFQVTDATPVTVRVMGHTPIATQTALVTPGYNTLIWDGTTGATIVRVAGAPIGASPLTIVPGNKPSDVMRAKAAVAAAGTQGRELVGNGIVLLYVLGPDGRPLGRPGKTAVLR
jgi:hypothetical protein